MHIRTILLAATVLSSAGVANAQDASEASQTAPADQTTAAPADDAIVVTGIRGSLRDSIRTKRRANSIVEVVTAEDVGKFPDNNVAESLSRLPGITVDHQFGEGEQLSIAGVEPVPRRSAGCTQVHCFFAWSSRPLAIITSTGMATMKLAQ